MSTAAKNPGQGRGRWMERLNGSCIRSYVKAWRFFNAIPGDLSATVAALLVVAWAMLRGRP